MSILPGKYFSLEEFEKDGPVPPDCLPALTELCQGVLDPSRDWAGCALIVTSGYRPPDANAAAHGQSNSEHMYSRDWAAADFYPADGKVRPLFDWMRLNPALPFHELILEHGANGSSVIHASWNRQKAGMRSVLEGATHNAEPYAKVDYVAFGGNHEAVQAAATGEA